MKTDTLHRTDLRRSLREIEERTKACHERSRMLIRRAAGESQVPEDESVQTQAATPERRVDVSPT